MGIRLIGSRLLIRAAKEKTESAGGIILTTAEKPMYGEVLYVGPGDYTADGEFIETSVKPGDTVMYTHNVGEEIEFEDETLLLMSEGQLVGVVV